MGSISLRGGKEEDVPRLVELLAQLGSPSTLDQVRTRLATLLASPADHILLAEVDGEVVGLATLHLSNDLEMDEKRCELTGLVVDERMRRSGIARMLVRAAEDLAVIEGAGLFYLRIASFPTASMSCPTKVLPSWEMAMNSPNAQPRTACRIVP